MAKFSGWKIIYNPGIYFCRNAQGEIDNLRRGGSDLYSILLGAALQVEEIQIWTDIDWISQ